MKTYLLAFLALLPACQMHNPIQSDEVQALMDVQREAWNRGDLAEFVRYYDEKMTFCGRKGLTESTEKLLENYQKAYPTAAERGVLTFDLKKIQALENQHALVIGRYHIQRETPSEGFFSLIVHRTPAGLRVLHDHTSEKTAVK